MSSLSTATVACFIHSPGGFSSAARAVQEGPTTAQAHDVRVDLDLLRRQSGLDPRVEAARHVLEVLVAMLLQQAARHGRARP